MSGCNKRLSPIQTDLKKKKENENDDKRDDLVIASRHYMHRPLAAFYITMNFDLILSVEYVIHVFIFTRMCVCVRVCIWKVVILVVCMLTINIDDWLR